MLDDDTKNLIHSCKSKPVYDKWYQRYCDYKIEMQIEEDDINAIIKFINFLNDSFKVSSIWQAASCINKY